MNKAYIKCFIQKRIPSVKFEMDDGCGTQHPESHVHCIVPEKDVYLLERAARDLGRAAFWPSCPNIGGQHRVVEV